MVERLALSPNPSPASGRGETTNGTDNAPASTGKAAGLLTPTSAGEAAGLLPSPAGGRGAGGEGRRLSRYAFAKSLRTRQTNAEERLWYFLRAHRLLGLKFKRQVPLGPYVADFVCMQYHLIIEADGSQHGTPADMARDRWLQAQGYTVLRFWNNQIDHEIDGVLESIRLAVLARGFVEPPSPVTDHAVPRPAGGQGRRIQGAP
ncbi:endonuclease domain-containing protein [Cupriavidus sp. SZY C1]|uniref:endonuclease domain-containing protein n=1 Tax=Cupriavidus sp. SZY C1 TaxID=3055037 RepID=UPI0028B4F363|nr:endonuclease domain-containing protein [Cupriavidus sp. SZY C1]MDT6961073.1 endonuclease domain-containing protein [Cupriavidus sp. SZY C1]